MARIANFANRPGRSSIKSYDSNMGCKATFTVGKRFPQRTCMTQKVKEEALEVEGVVTQALANTRFRVQLEGGHLVIAHVAGKMRKHFIRIVPGDKVRVELS